MFQHIVSVSSVCLLLAFAGWDKDASKTIQDDIFDPSMFEMYVDKYYSVTAGPWDWLCRVWSGEIEPPCPRCWSIFRPAGCVTCQRDQLSDLGVFSWVIHKVIYTIEDLGAVVDGFVEGKGAWLLLSTGVHLTLYVLHSQPTILQGLLFPKKLTRDSGSQKNTSIYRKIRIIRLRHRAELEEMARTVEYLQRERRKEQVCMEQKMIEVETLQNAIRQLYHSHAKGDVRTSGVVYPDFELDYKKHTGHKYIY